MLKITKGLKKKKKGKKNKHKEEELFDAAELAKYRLEHQAVPATESDDGQPQEDPGEGSKPAVENDEWQKFKALTAGVDSVLKKTQGDLNRIKSTSYFQRKPPGCSNAKPPPQPVSTNEAKHSDQRWVGFEEGSRIDDPPQPSASELQEASALPEPEPEPEAEESEEEEEEQDDDLFDTSYVDVVTSGDIKLAYIPDSPTEEPSDYDPFDTSIVERVIKPSVDKKGNRLVSLGCAVDVLTGILDKEKVLNAVLPTGGKKRRAIPKNDLLLGSFDENPEANEEPVQEPTAVASLLDDDAPLGSPGFEPLSSEYEQRIATPLPQREENNNDGDYVRGVVAEFDVVANEEDDEFASLAVESLSKPDPVANPCQAFPPAPDVGAVLDERQAWAEFEAPEGLEETREEDPFDTSFADNILPGKLELRLIEKEILRESEANEARILSRSDSDFDFDPRAGEEPEVRSRVSIHVTDPAGERQEEFGTLRPIHRDLLGGSTTDLSQICDQPIQPANEDEAEFDYADPFDTSVVDVLVAPGKAELKFLEKELLGEEKVNLKRSLSDEDFDPRGEECRHPAARRESAARPSVLDVKTAKVVAFDLPTPSARPDLLVVGHEEGAKATKPLTPFYVERKFSQDGDEEDCEVDPFDTSFASNIPPGKAELKLLENEFAESLSDQEFDPRQERPPAPDETVSKFATRRFSECPIQPSGNTGRRFSDFTGDRKRSPPKSLNIKKVTVPSVPEVPPIPTSSPKPDLLVAAAHEEFNAKALTPAVEERIGYLDPFDTSIASNLLPGRAELKVLESELISEGETSLKRSYTDPDFNPRDATPPDELPGVTPDLLNLPGTTGGRVLTPFVGPDAEDEINYDDIDPFDTSIVGDLIPGKAELRILESELIGQ